MPVRYSIRLRGAELVRQGLQNLKAEIPRIGQQDIYDAMKRAWDRVVKYPPELPGSRYVRTGTYGRAWTVKKSPGSGGSLGNRIIPGYTLVGNAVDRRGRDYTKYVGGDAYGLSQARIRQGRWVPARDAVDREVERLPQTVQNHLDSVARRVL
jgi:hypothetical protein